MMCMSCHNNRRHFSLGSLLGMFAFAILLAGCHAKGKDEDETGNERPKPVVKVAVRPVERKSLDDTIEVLGTTEPLLTRTARVTTAVEGRVAEILPGVDGSVNP